MLSFMYIYLFIIVIDQTYGAGRQVKAEKKPLQRISFEPGDSSTASSLMGRDCRLPSLSKPCS